MGLQNISHPTEKVLLLNHPLGADTEPSEAVAAAVAETVAVESAWPAGSAIVAAGTAEVPSSVVAVEAVGTAVIVAVACY